MKSISKKITKVLFWPCLIVIFIFAVTRNVDAQESCVAPPAGLISWWSGDGNAEDRMNNNPGTAENETTYGKGQVRQAFSFDGVDAYVNVPDSPTLDAITTEITVDFWIRPQQPDKNVWIFARRDPLVSEGFSILMYPGGELLINLRTENSWNPSGTVYSTDSIIQFGEWQHVAVTANTLLGQLDAYVNGNPVPLQLIYGPSISGKLVNVNNLFIGRRQSSDTYEGPVGGGHYVGEVDEVEIFARALSQAEIQAIYGAGTVGKCIIQVGIDIKPGSCPNPFKLPNDIVDLQGKLPVAILGTGELDVKQIDPATIKITRECDGCEPVAPFRWTYEDVATPFEGELCECHREGMDGYKDLTLKFGREELAKKLKLYDVAGQTIPLTITGNLKEENSGTPIKGQDCIKVKLRRY